MIDFDFQVRTKLYFGPGKEKLVGSILAENGAHRVLIVIGQGSVRKNGLLTVALESIKEQSLDYLVIEGVRPNPTVEFVKDAIIKAKEFNADFILSIGGGSVTDTAKSIAVGYYYDGDPFDFNLHKAVPKKALPLGVILTISAAGSEMSTSCVLQKDETGKKTGFNSDVIRPVFAIENPELTYSVSQYQTACGIVDIMMHTLERYFNASSDNEPADGFAEALLRSVIKAAKVVINNPTDYFNKIIFLKDNYRMISINLENSYDIRLRHLEIKDNKINIIKIHKKKNEEVEYIDIAGTQLDGYYTNNDIISLDNDEIFQVYMKNNKTWLSKFQFYDNDKILTVKTEILEGLVKEANNIHLTKRNNLNCQNSKIS